MKPFYKSKTIIGAAAALLFLLLDSFGGFNLASQLNEQLSAALTADELGNITKINFVAIFSIIFTIVMRFVSDTKVQTTDKMKDLKKVEKTFLKMPDFFKLAVIRKMGEKFQKEADELNTQIKKQGPPKFK